MTLDVLILEQPRDVDMTLTPWKVPQWSCMFSQELADPRESYVVVILSRNFIGSIIKAPEI